MEEEQTTLIPSGSELARSRLVGERFSNFSSMSQAFASQSILPSGVSNYLDGYAKIQDEIRSTVNAAQMERQTAFAEIKRAATGVGFASAFPLSSIVAGASESLMAHTGQELGISKSLSSVASTLYLNSQATLAGICQGEPKSALSDFSSVSFLGGRAAATLAKDSNHLLGNSKFSPSIASQIDFSKLGTTASVIGKFGNTAASFLLPSIRADVFRNAYRYFCEHGGHLSVKNIRRVERSISALSRCKTIRRRHKVNQHFRGALSLAFLQSRKLTAALARAFIEFTFGQRSETFNHVTYQNIFSSVSHDVFAVGPPPKPIKLIPQAKPNAPGFSA